ncbi:MAG: adenosylmethionine--8-amino-7-oxononanoate transaminase [Alphaproteobacteria bacterium]
MSNNSPIWHPFTQHAIAPEAIHVDRAAGAYLFVRDAHKNEKCVIDAISSWWVITHGHCHPDIMHAVQEQAGKLDQVIFAGFTHDAAEELAVNLIEVTDSSLSHVFYSDSGSTAVEVALKQAIGYWEHTGHPRRKIIALENGYHGDTFGTMSTGARSVYNQVYELFLFEVEHVPVPVAGCEGVSLEALERVLNAHKDDVAAFIFEPLIQGAGGMQIYTPETLKAMADMCRAHGVLLIADEVMTGFGRTGTMFACSQAGFAPDILCLSKGLTGGFLPMGATLCSADIYQAFYHKDKSKMFFHSSSFTGNALACAAANASLKIWRDEPVQDRIDTIAKSHASVSAKFSAREDVVNVRQKGTILAMDVVVGEGAGYLSEIQPKLYDAFLSQNVLLRPLGNTIYVLPPYCVTEKDLGAIYDAIHHALDQCV